VSLASAIDGIEERVGESDNVVKEVSERFGRVT